MTDTHAPIRPSALPLTIACNASVQMQIGQELPETDEQAEGHAAHWIALQYVSGRGGDFPVGTPFTHDGQAWTVTGEMMSGAVLYANTLDAPHSDIVAEQPIRVARVHPTYCWGWPDAYRYYGDARQAFAKCPPNIPTELFAAGRIKVLRVADYKFGHRHVEVFQHPQLVAYAAGAIDALNLNELDECLFIEFVLVQPRDYHVEGPVRRWITRASDLRGPINIASAAAHAALVPLGSPDGPKARTGNHCIDCLGRHMCTALANNVSHLVDFAQTAERSALPPELIGQELAIVDDALKQLEARRSGLAAQAEAVLRQGGSLPHYHLEPVGARLTYFDDVNVDELLALGDMLNIDLRKKLQRADLVVTPTQAIQMGIDASVMESYASRPRGAMKLARDNFTAAKKVFSK